MLSLHENPQIKYRKCHLKCLKCSFQTSNHRIIKVHCYKFHNIHPDDYNPHENFKIIEPIYKCKVAPSICSYTNKDQLIIEDHVKSCFRKIGENDLKMKFECSHLDCGKAFLTKDALNVHKLEHQEYFSLKCPEEKCAELFKSDLAVHRHMNKKHPDSKLNKVGQRVGKIYTCIFLGSATTYCPKPYHNTKQSLLRHMNYHDQFKTDPSKNDVLVIE